VLFIPGDSSRPRRIGLCANAQKEDCTFVRDFFNISLTMSAAWNSGSRANPPEQPESTTESPLRVSGQCEFSHTVCGSLLKDGPPAPDLFTEKFSLSFRHICCYLTVKGKPKLERMEQRLAAQADSGRIGGSHDG